MREKDVETEILNFLASQPDVFAWKVNTVGVFDTAKGIYRRPNSPFIIKGVADIIGVAEGGLFFAIEVKKASGSKRSEDQKKFIDKVNRMGGFACFASTVMEAQSLLEKIRAQRIGLSGDQKA